MHKYFIYLHLLLLISCTHPHGSRTPSSNNTCSAMHPSSDSTVGRENSSASTSGQSGPQLSPQQKEATLEPWTPPAQAPRPPLTIEKIDDHVRESFTNVRTQNFQSFDTESRMYGLSRVTPLGSGLGLANKLRISWRRGYIVQIMQWLRGKNGVLERTYHFCEGQLCRGEQRETVQIERDGNWYDDKEPVRVHRVYVDGEKTLKEESFDEIGQTVPPAIHLFLPETEVFARLLADGIRIAQHARTNDVLQVAPGTLFIDSSEAARAVKETIPYVTISGNRLILGISDKWFPPELLNSMKAYASEDNRTAVIPYTELNRDGALDNWLPLRFLVGKPMILYNDKDYSTLVHIRELHVEVALPYGVSNISPQEAFNTETAYVVATVEEELRSLDGWEWGHYAGFAVPQDLDEDGDWFERWEKEYVKTNGISEWEQYGEMYEQHFIASSPRYDFFFRTTSVGDYCDRNGDAEYRSASAVWILDRKTGERSDGSNALVTIYDEEMVPYNAIEDEELQGTVFFFAGSPFQGGREVHLLLFKDGQFTPLVDIPEPRNDIGPC